ncbi:hypothetical protein X560_0476 [Listeria fleischmannii 1991]|uniref:Phenylalanine--tRNA ligase beta subunit n=2 Tax=Listeria fleischmannii TaxID=1069827 RepID=A0A2X3H3Y4_9LIST|nr:DUF4479 family protein [Listeria fleischmannii]EMG28993.1 hypothetical protein LFLEISCH_02610 [Listeria fleischmannii subsp. fleischmannii LU2006-1]KMT60785.1 hypothetical protein X560_0476 [Listeria fleischmannii 1991]SQC65375.1 Phenylalanine--tRNA ligase beta subunit [Listeria fleischmannii subsp. fleischmannii]
MIANVLYNEKGIGDTLIVSIKDIDRYTRTFDKKGDVVRIFDTETGALSGFNIFNASRHFTLHANGKVTLTEEFVSALKKVIQEAGFNDDLNIDITPKFVVGYVESTEKHPNADKLRICQVDVKDDKLQIVCGAPNVASGQKVVVAKIGAVMPSGLIIKPSNLRGVDSYGMLCAARELAIPNAPEEKGILVLEDDYMVGEEFQTTF